MLTDTSAVFHKIILIHDQSTILRFISWPFWNISCMQKRLESGNVPKKSTDVPGQKSDIPERAVTGEANWDKDIRSVLILSLDTNPKNARYISYVLTWTAGLKRELQTKTDTVRFFWLYGQVMGWDSQAWGTGETINGHFYWTAEIFKPHWNINISQINYLKCYFKCSISKIRYYHIKYWLWHQVQHKFWTQKCPGIMYT